jgi:hypothetical protein
MFAFFKQVLTAIMIVGAFALATTTVQAGENSSRVPGPEFSLPESTEKCVHDRDFAKTGKCVRDTAFMRRNHMGLLKHKRDLTMRKGVRTQDSSLQNCINCHVTKDAAGKAIKVSNRKHFCAACHTFAAVKLDCFECHRSTPNKAEGTARIPNIPAHSGLLAANTPAGASEQAKKLGQFLEGVTQ